MPLKILCATCRTPFTAERRSAKFCGATCRKRHGRNPIAYRRKIVTLTSNSVTGLRIVPLTLAPPRFSTDDVLKSLNGPLGKHTSIKHETPVVLHLDGRKVAASTMRHIVMAGNAPAQGARLPDYSGTRPISV
jgi:hypothetical protein